VILGVDQRDQVRGGSRARSEAVVPRRGCVQAI
jgi:hypothetical protein